MTRLFLGIFFHFTNQTLASPWYLSEVFLNGIIISQNNCKTCTLLSRKFKPFLSYKIKLIKVETYSTSGKRHHLFLEFWLVDTWFFTHWHHQRAVTRLENVGQSNIRRGKKLDFQLPHKHPLKYYEYKINSGSIYLKTLLGFNWHMYWEILKVLGNLFP